MNFLPQRSQRLQRQSHGNSHYSGFSASSVFSVPSVAHLLLLAACLLVWTVIASAEDGQVKDTLVPMRDGVKLATTAYLPAGNPPWPVVLMRTPYNKDGAKGQAKGFNDRGFALVAQDCRGRYKSEGVTNGSDIAFRPD